MEINHCVCVCEPAHNYMCLSAQDLHSCTLALVCIEILPISKSKMSFFWNLLTNFLVDLLGKYPDFRL